MLFKTLLNGIILLPKPVDDPMLIIEGDILDPEPRNRFIELTNAATDTNPLTNFNNTYDGGKTWQFKGSMNFNASSNNPQVSSMLGSPVVYQSISLTETTPQGWGKIGLVRMSNLNQTGNGLLERADLNGFGSLGIFPTMFKWYNVLGVNPNNSNHVIIADVANSKIKVTWDGGKNWFNDDEITELVTSFGAFKFYAIVDCCPKIIVTCINFNPADPNQIAIGTRENGLFMSWDRGESWFPVNDTKRITNPSKIFFYFDNSILVSTYGRGLWKFNPVRGEKPPRPFGRLKGSYIFEINKNSAKRLEANFSDSGISHDSKIIMFNDSLFRIDLKYLRSNRIKQLKINNIALWDLRQQFKESSDYIDITFPETSNRENPEFDTIQIRGIIVNPNNEASELILGMESYKLFTPDQLLVKEMKEPYIELRNEEGIYTSSVHLNKTYMLKGYYFSANDRVSVFINDSLMYNINVLKNGTFEQEILPSRVIDSYRFKIDVEGIYNSERIRRTLLIQVLRKGDEFEPVEARR